MYFDPAGMLWYWFIASAVLWTPIANNWHATGFRRGWIVFSIIWWLPIIVGNLLRLAVPAPPVK